MEFLTRDNFREQVLERDDHRCVICGNKENLSAHHIIERRLWGESGGYCIENGATLCEEHHLLAEQTVLSCEEIREAAGIIDVVLPEHLYRDDTVDKWGNIILSNGTRMKGELFFDSSVQKILQSGNVLDKFVKYVKYPRTYHCPWSENLQNDDRMIQSMEHIDGQEVVATLKYDGECTTVYQDYIHARSLSSNPHPSRNWVKNLQGKIGYNIPDGYRVCGENLFAKHSLRYKNLPSYFLMFSIWNEMNTCLSWNETKEWASLLGLEMVPEFYRGIFDKEKIHKLFHEQKNEQEHEGYVVRVVRDFTYGEFRKVVMKWVRKEHVRTHAHWMHSAIEKNGLKAKIEVK